MALLKFDGFDGAAPAELASLYGFVVGGSPTAAAGRFAGSLNAQSMQWAGGVTGDYLEVPFGSAKDVWVIGFAFQCANNTVQQRVLTARNGATECFNIVKTTGGLLTIRQGTSTTTLATGTQVLTGGQWYYVEVKFNYPGSGNPTATVKVNGTTDVTYTGSLGAQTACTLARIGGSFSSVVAPPTLKVDDLYLLDNTGSQNNDFLGDCRVELVTPDTENANTGFSANTGTTPAAVDDVTQDGDTTYIFGTAAADIINFTVTDLSNTPTAIFGVSVQAVAKKTDAGTRTLRTNLTSGATKVDGSAATLTTTYAATTPQIIALDPDGSIPWTRASVEAAKIGVEIVS